MTKANVESHAGLCLLTHGLLAAPGASSRSALLSSWSQQKQIQAWHRANRHRRLIHWVEPPFSENHGTRRVSFYFLLGYLHRQSKLAGGWDPGLHMQSICASPAPHTYAQPKGNMMWHSQGTCVSCLPIMRLGAELPTCGHHARVQNILRVGALAIWSVGIGVFD